MSFFKECPDCGAHLDPGEKCDCTRMAKEAAEKIAFPSTHADAPELAAI